MKSRLDSLATTALLIPSFLQLLDKLCDLDYRFKVDSQIDEKLKLELFLMELL